jgi:hypothetical protein
VTAHPAPAYVELTDGGQALNCDLLVENPGGVARTLQKIEVTVLDRKGALTYRRFLDGNGVSPSILTIPNREVPPSGRVLLLNPLHTFPRDVDLATVRFELTFDDGVATAEVSPVVYRNHAKLRLPLGGRLIVWDGHDFTAHHRRWDYVFEPIKAFGFTSNVGRYSYDFVPIDESGEMLHGDAADNASWVGWQAPIVSPAAGTVVAVVDDKPDNRNFDMELLKQDLGAVYGNYVVIDHGHGEHSVFGHIAEHSAAVKVGAKVKAGDVIAKVGASGSAMFPHLHYQLQNAADGHAEGLPSYFHDFVRVRGTSRVKVKEGQVDSGEIVENRKR